MGHVKPKHPGILEVAKHANVSAMTVTRAFNDSAPVAEKTKKRIFEIAEKLGYRPNLLARGLRSGKTQSVGILWSLGGPHESVELVRKISLEVQRNGYVTYIADSLSDPRIIKQVLTDYTNRNIDGLIFQVNTLHLAEDPLILTMLNDIQSVILVSPTESRLQFDTIIRDRYQAIEEIVDYFVSTGRKRPVVITDSPGCQDRVDRFLDRLRFHGLSPIKNAFIQRLGDKNKNIGKTFINGLKTVFPNKIPFDAVWCTTDEGAAAVMTYLKAKGLRIPEDVAVVGFNNSEMASYTTPPLASVKRFTEKVTKSASQMLLKRLQDPDKKIETKAYPMRFIKRASAG